MSKKDVTIKEWECEACGKKEYPSLQGNKEPYGWTSVTVDLQNYTKGADICETCSTNPEAAKKRVAAAWGM